MILALFSSVIFFAILKILHEAPPNVGGCMTPEQPIDQRQFAQSRFPVRWKFHSKRIIHPANQLCDIVNLDPSLPIWIAVELCDVYAKLPALLYFTLFAGRRSPTCSTRPPLIPPRSYARPQGYRMARRMAAEDYPLWTKSLNACQHRHKQISS